MAPGGGQTGAGRDGPVAASPTWFAVMALIDGSRSSSILAKDVAPAMFGPQPRGAWTAHRISGNFAHLRVGARYAVSVEFRDFDGRVHPTGEAWTYLGHAFLPYDDGLSLFISLDREQEWHIRLQWREDAQGPVIDALDEHIRLLDP